MRSLVRAVFAGIAALSAPMTAQAQDTPSKPIPYTQLARKPVAKPRPVAAPVAATTPTPAAAVLPSAPPATGARLAAGQPIPAAELERFVDGAVQEAMARQHIAGVTVAVVQNGQVLLKKGYGFASLSPRRAVDPDRTLFRLGSISKTFTWIGVMKEVEAGRIRLNQPVNLYLPERLQVRDQGYDQPVRVVDLMAHSAGFDDRSYGHLFEQDAEYVRPLELYLRKERARRVRAPGQVASYSNYGAGLAGAAVAWTSGRPFERLMEEELFLPLGMTRTSFREKRPAKAGLPAPMPAALAADAADGFRWTRGGFRPSPYEYIGHVAPAGSASSTAGDMARYMLALLGGGQLGGVVVYGPATAQAFRTPILATPPGINGWAHGFIAEPLPGGRTGYGHAGSTLAFMSNMVTAPDLGLGVFVATNTNTGLALARDLPQAIVREFYAAPRPYPRADSPELARHADLFTGHYLSSRRGYAGLEGLVGLLVGGAEVRVAPEGRLVTADAMGPKLWVPDGPIAQGRFVAVQGEEELAFRMSDGRAVAYTTSAGVQRFERAPFWRSPGALGLMAGLTAGAALVSLFGAMLRNRRELRESPVQSRAALVQNLQAGLWLTGMASFAFWGAKTLVDPSRLVFGWPSPLLVTASACALVAAALTVTTLVALPAVWRGGRRVDSWPIVRRAGFTLTVAIYLVFSALLVQTGALFPWSG